MMLSTPSRDRRVGSRIDFHVFLNQYEGDRRFRVLATNLSETGLLVGRVNSSRESAPVFGLEIELPGASETIWARGEVCRKQAGDLVSRAGIRFTGIAGFHARLLRDYCIEARHIQLASMLRSIRSVA